MKTRQLRGHVTPRWMSLCRVTSAVTAALALAACGGGGGGGGGGSAPTPPVATNNAPTVSADARLIVAIDGSVALQATGSDPDGDTLNYTWTQTRGLAVSNETGA
ncbi:MAG: hypothetical protein AAFN50_08790, partial [Pseudomonadota bacterium]